MRRRAIYPGSFDPLTLGHLDVIERASGLFDELVVSVGVNSGKKRLLSVEERMAGIRLSVAHLPNVSVDSFSGLLAAYASRLEARVIVRGLRATADFEYEFQMATVNRKLTGDLETVFLMTKWEHSYLSSTIVKEVARLGGDFAPLVPPALAEIIGARLALDAG
jgi:pantetheine-phosphate adenylyltransferase